MEPNIQPITTKYLEEVFSSGKFCRRLTMVADFTLEMNAESSFSVGREIYNNNLIYGLEDSSFPDEGGVRPLSQTSYAGGWRTGIDKATKFSLDEGEVYPFLQLHTHPLASDLTPSPEDFETMFYMRGSTFSGSLCYKINTKPIIGIAMLTTPKKVKGKLSKRKMELLLVQESTDKPILENRGEEFYDKLEQDTDSRDNKTIARTLNQFSEFNALLITYEKKVKFYRPSRLPIESLEMFSYSPSIIGKINMDDIVIEEDETDPFDELENEREALSE